VTLGVTGFGQEWRVFSDTDKLEKVFVCISANESGQRALENNAGSRLLTFSTPEELVCPKSHHEGPRQRSRLLRLQQPSQA
jgi:hypothetical protein